MRFVRPRSHIAVSLALGTMLAAPSWAETSPFTDLPADHWAYPAVQRLVDRGILSGYPDGSFRGSNLVTRYALAVSLAKAMENGLLAPPNAGGGAGGDRVKLTVEDLETLEGLIKEFGEELALVGVKTAAVEEQLRAHGDRLESLESRVEDLEEGKGGPGEKVRFDGGRFRALGYNKSAINGSMDMILDVGVDLNSDVEGHVGLRYTNIFDQIDNETFGTYEAFLRSKRAFGPIDQVRAGKMNNFLGNGLVLYDRREGLEITSHRDDLDFELSYFDALLAHVSTDVLGSGRLGFYYIKQDRTGGRRPGHLGVYAKGETDGGIDYAMELTEYDNDGATASNRDRATNSFYFGLGAKPKGVDGIKLRAGYLVQEEDYRALAVDSDLRWQGVADRVSPHHDMLQALRDATPAGVDPDEVPGFRDLQLGVDFDVPNSRWSGRFGIDMMRGHTRTLNHSADDFDVYTLAVERKMDQDLEVQLRFQGIDFDNPSGVATVAGIPALRRQDTNNVRAQVVKRF